MLCHSCVLQLTHMSACPCVFGPAAQPDKVSELYKGYKAALARVAAAPALRSPLFAAVHLARYCSVYYTPVAPLRTVWT